MSSSLGDMHSLTVTLLVFVGKRKTKTLKIVMQSKNYQDTFSELGTEWEVSSILFEKLEAFTCLLYTPKVSSTNFN